MSHPAGPVGEGVQAELGAVNGGLRGSRELQGGRTLIIRRPHVAKFMFIWAARRKSFPGGQRWKLIGRILCSNPAEQDQTGLFQQLNRKTSFLEPLWILRNHFQSGFCLFSC